MFKLPEYFWEISFLLGLLYWLIRSPEAKIQYAIFDIFINEIL